MLKLFTGNKTVNLAIDNYVIRMVDCAGDSLKNIRAIKEKAIPNGLLEHGRIIDEIEFFRFIKDTVREWGIRRRDVRFYVPDSLVIMKKVRFPAKLKDEEIKGHFIMELGRTLYLPFENPILDIFPLPKDDQQSEREGLLFAVPEEEIKKYTEIFADASLNPIAADVRFLGVYRYYRHLRTNSSPEDVQLFFEINLDSILISIFSNEIPEFFRYINLDLKQEDWNSEYDESNYLQWTFAGDKGFAYGLIDDQLMELERIMNFYRYSLHKGEKGVASIMLLGDFPRIDTIYDKIQAQTEVKVELLKTANNVNGLSAPSAFIPALGLALKEGAK